MEQEPNDIIRQLADRLKEHELPYQQGAWERFLEKQAVTEKMEAEAAALAGAEKQVYAEKKGADAKVLPLNTGAKGRTGNRLWRTLGAAAAILIAIGAGWLYLGQRGADTSKNAADQQVALSNGDASGNDRPSVQPSPKVAITAPNVNITADVPSPEDLSVASTIAAGAIASIPLEEVNGFSDLSGLNPDALRQDKPGLQINPVGPVFTLLPPDNKSEKRTTESNNHTGNQADLKGIYSNAEKQDKAALAGALGPKKDNFDDRGYFQVGGQQQNQHDEQGAAAGRLASRKWQMGVMVVPGLSNNAKLNMGYGVSVGYRLNKRLSLNSGLAYAALTGAKDATELQSAKQGITTLASSGRALSAIEASVTGLKVPLELRYQLNSKIYIGTGVSAMAVLSDKVERRYTIAQMQSSALQASSGGMLKADAMQSLASNVKTTEVIPDDEVGAKNVAGFINFSLGLQQPINKNKSISIEPFVSVPMNNHLFNQNIKMTDAGIRIKLGL